MVKKFFLFLLIFFTLSMPLLAKAEVMVLECYKQGNCGFCDALLAVSKIAQFFLFLAGSSALLFFVIGGLMWIMSGGSASRIKSGERMLIGSLIGLGIVYFAWVGVNFVIYNFSDVGQGSGGVGRIFSRPWYEIKCVKEPTEYYVAPQPPVVEVCKSSWESGREPSCGGSCMGFQLVTSESQCSDASPALVNFLTCLDKELKEKPVKYSPLTKEQIVLTSISDDAGLKKCRDNYSQPPCIHKNNSCHYGHGETNGSYAIDVRSWNLSDSIRLVQFPNLVRQCGGEFIDETYVEESPHLHASAGACTGR